MQFLRNFSKTIQVILHIIVLGLLVGGVIFLFTKQLFVGDESAVQIFRMGTGKPMDMTLFGVYKFGDTFINSANKATLIDHNIYSEANLAAASCLKVLVIVCLVLLILLAVAQVLPFRKESTLALIVLNMILLTIFVNFTVKKFTDTQLITAATNSIKHVYLFFSFAAIICFVNVAFKYLIKPSKTTNSNAKKK